MVWQSRSGEVSFGEVWLGRFALERIGLDLDDADRRDGEPVGCLWRRGAPVDRRLGREDPAPQLKHAAWC